MTVTHEGIEKEPTGPLLLIVEDSAVQRVMLQRLLVHEGYRLLLAKDGQEGLTLVRTHRPSLVISDISMPVMDGYAMCRLIKHDAELRHIPVLLLTGLDDPAEVIRALDAGADNYLTKPVEDAHLLGRIGSLLVLHSDDSTNDDQDGMQITFAGETHRVHATPRQTLNLLLSTYENAVRKNRELIQAQMALNLLTEHLEDEVRQRTRALEVANRVKTEFIANISHEVRTPMNAIMGMTDLVLHSTLDDQQREMLGIARTASETLLKLLNSLLDFARMEKGEMKLALDMFALRSTVREFIAPFLAKMAEKGLAFCCRVSPEIPDTLLGDFPHIGQILDQLLGNALKFTERGFIHFEMTQLSMSEDRVVLRFSVVDSGIGISQEQQEWVFESFAQGDGSKTRKYGGTGLGLSLAKRLADIMGSPLGFKSEAGQGSVFYLDCTFLYDANALTVDTGSDGIIVQTEGAAQKNGTDPVDGDILLGECSQLLQACEQAIQANKMGSMDSVLADLKQMAPRLPVEMGKAFAKDILRLSMAVRSADGAKCLVFLQQLRETLAHS